MISRRVRQILVPAALAVGISAAGILATAPNALAANGPSETDYNAVLSGAPLPHLCEQRPIGSGPSGATGDQTNCVVG